MVPPLAAEMATLMELESPYFPEAVISIDDDRATFTLGRWTVSCLPTRPAILALAARLRRGCPASVLPRNPYRFSIVDSRNPSLRQTFSRGTLAVFSADGELENATSYRALMQGGG